MLWVDIGTAEGTHPNSILRDARLLREVLRRKGWKEGEDLAYLEEQGRSTMKLRGAAHAPHPPLSFWQARNEYQIVNVRIVTTGGTIEKVYSEQSGQVENRHGENRPLSAVAAASGYAIEVTPLMNKDSLEMTEEDRELILSVVQVKRRGACGDYSRYRHDGGNRAAAEGRLTDLKHSDILTGAMTPLGFERSDGLQNLTESLFAARVLPAGRLDCDAQPGVRRGSRAQRPRERPFRGGLGELRPKRLRATLSESPRWHSASPAVRTA